LKKNILGPQLEASYQCAESMVVHLNKKKIKQGRIFLNVQNQNLLALTWTSLSGSLIFWEEDICKVSRNKDNLTF
jgi:hypothetical protein